MYYVIGGIIGVILLALAADWTDVVDVDLGFCETQRINLCVSDAEDREDENGTVDPRIATAQAEADAQATEAAVQATLTAIAQTVPTAQPTSIPNQDEEGMQPTPSDQARDDIGTGANEAVLEETTLQAGDAAVVRIIRGNTATVCYSQSLLVDTKVGTQSNGDVIAAWARPDRQPWGWMMGDAANEAQRIRDGSLASEGVTNVQGPMVCQ